MPLAQGEGRRIQRIQSNLAIILALLRGLNAVGGTMDLAHCYRSSSCLFTPSFCSSILTKPCWVPRDRRNHDYPPLGPPSDSLLVVSLKLGPDRYRGLAAHAKWVGRETQARPGNISIESSVDVRERGPAQAGMAHRG